MNISEMRSKSVEELKTELIALRQEQFDMRMKRGAGKEANPARGRLLRKDIARIKTVLTEKDRN